MLLGRQHTRQGQGFVLLQPCTVALPLQRWLIALSLSVSPLVLFSQTCHLVLPGAGTPVGHFFSPFSSELILASPSLIFHCLSPLSPPQLSPLGAASCSSDCMSSGTTPLTSCHACRQPSQAFSSCTVPCSFPRWHCPALHAPGQAPGCPWVRCLSCAKLYPVPWLWLAFPGCQGSRTGSLLISRGEKNGSKLKKAEQSHLHGWECLAGL